MFRIIVIIRNVAIFIFRTMVISNEIISIVKKLRGEGKSYNIISKTLGITKSQVQYALHRKLKVIKKKKGPPKKIGKAAVVSIKRNLSKLTETGERVNSTKIKRDLSLNVSTRTVQRTMKSLQFKYQKVSKYICINKSNKALRVTYATQWLTNSVDWSHVIFSDEKRFSRDGPDCWMSYIRPNSRNIRVKRQMKGGSLMYWGMVLSSGTVHITKMNGRQRSQDYIDLLKTFAVPIIKEAFGNNFVLQQDNCSIHTSKVAYTFYKNSGLSVLEWPPHSPDLNIMENV